ncbi:hypothetical protein LB941_00885 [Ligilactobacillus sp. WILCCON 0076]|uniref:Uncharacterized protein n=1 Tax=Ligilactobacillus ubinensis TaxID=2876789 RepID=A0A9X2FK98_9LACO|nr:hypothetical protein [Ligilactobacillus ubinensis]MCP0885888.1 hypothetical protein [Ligilactobacillus ubinensis]
MLDKENFYKTLIIAESIGDEMQALNNCLYRLIELIEKSEKGLVSLLIARQKVDEAEKILKIQSDLSKPFAVLCGMVDEFVENNFDWCSKNLNEAHLEFIGMA